MEGRRGKVCVTGGTGYIGSWLIMKLLEDGYSVNATMRPDPERKRDISYLKNLPGASSNLRIFEADFDDPDSFDPAIEGCIGVFHAAQRVDLSNKEPEEVVTKAAVKGVLGILNACLKSKTVKRILYTSSNAAVVFNGEDADLMDESFWTDVDFVKDKIQFGKPYVVSKTLAEKTAINFAEEHGLDLVTVNPSLVSGPFVCPQLPESVRITLCPIFGYQDMYPFLLSPSIVHIDDVVRAIIFLFECPDAKGRYICSTDSITVQQMIEIFTAKYPELKIPDIEALKELKGVKIPGVTSKKLLDTGFKFEFGLEKIFDEAIQCCKEKGYL